MKRMEQSTQGRRPLQLLAVLFWCVLFAALIVRTVQLLQVISVQIPYPFPRNYGEGIALDRALAVARHEPLYTPTDRAPYITWNFPPLYAWIAGLGAGRFGAPFAFGRAVSAVAVLASALLLFLLTRRQLRAEAELAPASTRWAAAASLLFLAAQPVVRWAAMMRCDLLGMAFGLAGLLAAVAGPSPIAAGVLFGLALLCKQSLIAGLLAACLWFGRAKQGRSLGRMLGACAATVGVVCLWAQISSHGWFARHVILSNRNAWRFHILHLVVRDALRGYELLFLLAGLAVVTALRARRSRPARAWVGAYYLSGAVVVTALAGKIGSDSNYLLDLLAAACLLAVWGLAWLEVRLDRRWPALAGAGACLAAGLLGGHLWRTAWQIRPPAMYRSAAPELHILCDRIAAVPGPVVCEEPGLVPAGGKRLWLQPFEFTQMSLAGVWDQRPLVESLRRGDVPLLVLSFSPWNAACRDRGGATWMQGRFTDEMIAAIRSAYVPSEMHAGWLLLRPRVRK